MHLLLGEKGVYGSTTIYDSNHLEVPGGVDAGVAGEWNNPRSDLIYAWAHPAQSGMPGKC